jgi:predicted transcriptional regulator
LNYGIEFAANVKNIMYGKGISGVEMARHLDVAPSTMSEYLSGHKNWPLDKAIKCADYLSSNVYKIIGRDES